MKKQSRFIGLFKANKMPIVVFLIVLVVVWTIGTVTLIAVQPRVRMWFTQRELTDTEKPTLDGLAPLNQFIHGDRLVTHQFRRVVRANNDVLYSSAWLDLSDEPIVLHVPDMQDRYYCFQMLDNWTYNFAYVGRRTTGTKEGNFAIVGPGWEGTLPKNVKRIDAPTNTVWLIGRTLVKSQQEVEEVHALTKQFTLTPLGQYED